VVALLLDALAHDAEGRADDQQVLPDGSAFAANLIDDLFARIQASGMLRV
jgi:hypothetical protein